MDFKKIIVFITLSSLIASSYSLADNFGGEKEKRKEILESFDQENSKSQKQQIELERIINFCEKHNQTINDESKSKIEKKDNELTQQKNELTQQKADLKLLAAQLDEANAKITKAQAVIASSKIEIENLNKETKDQKNEITTQDENNKNSLSLIEKLTNENKELSQKNDALVITFKENNLPNNKVVDIENLLVRKTKEQKNIVSLIGSYGPTGHLGLTSINDLS